MCWNGYPGPPRDEDDGWQDSDGDDEPGQWLQLPPDPPFEYETPKEGTDPLYDLLKIERPKDEEDGS